MAVQWVTRSAETAQESSLSGLDIVVPDSDDSNNPGEPSPSESAEPTATKSPKATATPSASASASNPATEQEGAPSGGQQPSNPQQTTQGPGSGNAGGQPQTDPTNDDEGDSGPAPEDEPEEEAPVEEDEPDVADPGVNLAAGASVEASSQAWGGLSIGNILDGVLGSYWEAGPGFPQTVTVDLGRVTTVGRVALSLPASWHGRTQTITILGSVDGSSYSTLKGSAAYQFRSSTDNQASASFSQTPVRYVQLRFTGANGWTAAQLGGLSLHSS
nr:discoidin domain-containing protein [Kineosporia babensis]